MKAWTSFPDASLMGTISLFDVPRRGLHTLAPIEIERRGIKGPSKSRLVTERSEPLPLTAGNESPHPLLCLVAGSCLTTRQIKRVSSGTYRLENAPRLETIR